MTAQLPDGLDSLLTRVQTGNALTQAGYPTSTATLSTMATRGGGPPFCKWGPRAMYRWGDALAWAEARITRPQRNTSDTNGKRAA